MLIWTTTPWTIPANLAIAVHPDFDYALFDMNGELHIAATGPAAGHRRAESAARYEKLAEFKGAELRRPARPATPSSTGRRC